MDHARIVWRGVRGRGWRAGLTIGLLALALAANTVVFSATDSFVFGRVPFPQADRLVEIADQNPRTGAPESPFVAAGVLDEWRRQTDVFVGVEAYLTKTLFLTSDATVRAPVADVTPGLFHLLGATPRWGRALTADDAAQVDPQVVVISEGLARGRFGDPVRAVGQTISTATRPLLVVGVMASDFAFPNSMTRVWRALDPRGPLARGFAGVHSIARLAPDIPFDVARAAVQDRSPSAGVAAALRDPYHATLTALPMAASPETQRRLFLVILGTAVCLLLTACANVASLEIAGAIRRSRTQAIQRALGASHRRLVAESCSEGLLLVLAATALAFIAARTGVATLAAYLPESIAYSTVRPIGVDARALAFMSMAALVTWLFASLPLVVLAMRTDVGELLKQGGSGTAPPRASRLRQVLTIGEVAVAVVLLVGMVLYARTYIALTGLDTGFDMTNVAVVTVSLPARVYPTLAEKRAFAETTIHRLLAAHVIENGMWGTPPPDVGARYQGHVQVDGDSTRPAQTWVGAMEVEPSYFSTLGIPLRRGRTFASGNSLQDAIINEAMASRLWPGQDPIGHLFRWSAGMPWQRVVGVAGDVRTDFDRPDRPRGSALQVYTPLHAVPAIPVQMPTFEDNGGAFGFVNVVLRVDRPSQLATALRLVRSIEPRGEVQAEMLGDAYATRYADRLLAAQVMGGFGVLAFLLAGAGVYGVMTFLVASRAREIGIRMALGADRAAIARLVVRTSAAVFVTGIGAGALAAAAASRTIASQLFGVTPADPAAWTGVIAAIVVLAAIATWYPARAATRLDPSTLLRN